MIWVIPANGRKLGVLANAKALFISKSFFVIYFLKDENDYMEMVIDYNF
jgi:hypothetical protein